MTLDHERDLVDHGLVATGLGWRDWPGCAVSGALDDRAVLATLLLILAERENRPRVTVVVTPTAADGPDVIDRLRRRRLPWDSAAAALALDVVTRSDEMDERRFSVALRGAEEVCAAGRAEGALLQRLQACRDWLDALPSEWWGVPQARLQVRRVIAAAAPPDVLDLSLVLDTDGWGAPARELARAADPDAVAPLVRLLGELGARKPSQRWLRDCGELLAPVAARTLLEGWLRQAADAPVVVPDDTLAFSGGMLFAPGNDDLVRAAVVATSLLPGEPWVPEVLGVLARRGAATSHVPGMTAALALKVASAAIDALAARGTPADRAVLEELLEDLSRRDLVKRIGVALGRQEEAAARDDELRRTKAATVRRKADPVPRRARAAVDALIRRHIVPGLREAGFQGSGRTWRRCHVDRVDVVGIGSGGDRVDVGYGVWFDAVHPDGETYPVARDEVRPGQFDITLSMGCRASAESLDRIGRRLVEDVVPFLDSLGRYELVRAYIERGAGVPRGSVGLDNAGSPVMHGVLGLLALAAGDRPTAVENLTQRLAFAESERPRGEPSVRDLEIGFWREQLVLSQRLPAVE